MRTLHKFTFEETFELSCVAEQTDGKELEFHLDTTFGSSDGRLFFVDQCKPSITNVMIGGAEPEPWIMLCAETKSDADDGGTSAQDVKATIVVNKVRSCMRTCVRQVDRGLYRGLYRPRGLWGHTSGRLKRLKCHRLYVLYSTSRGLGFHL